jgi:hypothetical protein
MRTLKKGFFYIQLEHTVIPKHKENSPTGKPQRAKIEALPHFYLKEN